MIFLQFTVKTPQSWCSPQQRWNSALRAGLSPAELGWGPPANFYLWKPPELGRAQQELQGDNKDLNKSTGFTPFQLWMGCSPWLIPPLVLLPHNALKEDISAHEVINKLHEDVAEAQDSLLHAKITQAIESNKDCSLNFPFPIGSHIWLTTLHQCNEYKAKGEKHVAKFMLHCDSPYTIVNTNEKHSTVTIELPNSPNIFPTFHTSEVLPFIECDTNLFPSCKLDKPPPILTPEGNKEFFIDKILDQQCQGHSYQYLICWWGYSLKHDQWLPGAELQDCLVLKDWLASRVKCLDLHSLSFSPSPAGSFFPLGFDAPMLGFYLPFTEVFIVLHWFLPESRQFLEFQRNQVWHTGLPNL